MFFALIDGIHRGNVDPLDFSVSSITRRKGTWQVDLDRWTLLSGVRIEAVEVEAAATHDADARGNTEADFVPVLSESSLGLTTAEIGCPVGVEGGFLLVDG